MRLTHPKAQQLKTFKAKQREHKLLKHIDMIWRHFEANEWSKMSLSEITESLYHEIDFADA